MGVITRTARKRKKNMVVSAESEEIVWRNRPRTLRTPHQRDPSSFAHLGNHRERDGKTLNGVVIAKSQSPFEPACIDPHRNPLNGSGKCVSSTDDARRTRGKPETKLTSTPQRLIIQSTA